MPDIPSKEIISLLNYLLPGFLSVWIFNSLTSNSSENQFEKVIQALIFNLFVQIPSSIIQYILIFIGNYYTVAEWTDISTVSNLTFNAILVGLIATYITNNDKIHVYLREFKISKNISHESQWHSAFYENERYVILHLNDKKRIQGYPIEYPTDPKDSYLLLVNCSWLDKKNNPIEMTRTSHFLIPTSDIRWIEFQKTNSELKNGQE